jgi:dienelactone hydrolase
MRFCLLYVSIAVGAYVAPVLPDTVRLAQGAEPAGHQAEAKVSAATRLDWTFALANQSLAEPPADWLPDYDSSSQAYEVYVPRSLKAAKPAGLILFISPGDRGLGLEAFRKVCDEKKLIFASPHNAGNETPPRRRVRIVLDVLDDLRRGHAIDAERTYIGGFSGGGRIACAIGFALPEYFGGVLPVCAAGDLREESWLRRRVIDRLSVAHLTGDGDFNRGEVERFRGPMLAAVGVRSKVWVAPNTGHALPSPAVVEKAVIWLETGADDRRKLARQYPATSTAPDTEPSRRRSAELLLAEGKARLEGKQTLHSGLMQLQGVLTRWPDLPAAEKARAFLLKHEAGDDRSWEKDDINEQRVFLVARARALSDYATGPLAEQYRAQRADMLAAAIELWNQVLADGQDKNAVSEAEKRLPELKKRMVEEKH